jgi:hypothetical protein
MRCLSRHYCSNIDFGDLFEVRLQQLFETKKILDAFRGRRQAGKAAPAAAIAWPTSSPPASGTLASNSAVAGLVTSTLSTESLATHSASHVVGRQLFIYSGGHHL